MGLYVALPTEGSLRVETALAVLGMLAELQGECDFAYQINRPVDRCRNDLVDRFLKTRHDRLLFLDSDIVPPRRFWERLEAVKAPIVGATCIIQMNRRLVTNAFALDASTRRLRPIERLPADRGPIEVDALGMGCTLIRREVFDKMDRPWFRFASPEAGGAGEDLDFCQRARAAGMRVVIEPRVVCEHIRTAFLGEAYQQIHGGPPT